MSEDFLKTAAIAYCPGCGQQSDGMGGPFKWHMHCAIREIERLRAEKAKLVEFAEYVLEMDPDSDAPLFAKARAALADIRNAEWCINMARQEGGAEIGAGALARDPEMDDIERERGDE